MTAALRSSTWAARADRYRRHTWWCENCERRPSRRYCWRTVIAFDVHHRAGRGIWSPLGQEPDRELQTLCERCHEWVTRRHKLAGEANGSRRGGRTVDPELYAETIWRATRREHRRTFWRRALRRLLPLAPIDGRPR